MNLLAIDTSTETASVALMVDKKILADSQDSQRTHAQLILPMIDNLLSKSGVSLPQLDGIVFGCGPGSFTGLRIACSVAKGLAYAHDLAMIPVSSLAAIAWEARGSNFETPVLSVLDARMNEMYWAYFAAGEFNAAEQVSPVSQIKLPEKKKIILAGVGLEHYWQEFPKEIKSQILVQQNLFPNAEAMINLALHASFPFIPAEKAQPIYVRNQVTQGVSRG